MTSTVLLVDILSDICFSAIKSTKRFLFGLIFELCTDTLHFKLEEIKYLPSGVFV